MGRGSRGNRKHLEIVLDPFSSLGHFYLWLMGLGDDAATTAETEISMEIEIELARIDWNVEGRDEEIALDEAFEARIESELWKVFPGDGSCPPFDVVYDRNGAFGARNRIHISGASSAKETVVRDSIEELIKSAWKWTVEHA